MRSAAVCVLCNQASGFKRDSGCAGQMFNIRLINRTQQVCCLEEVFLSRGLNMTLNCTSVASEQFVVFSRYPGMRYVVSVTCNVAHNWSRCSLFSFIA